MGTAVEQRMDELLAVLGDAGPEERKQISAELSRLNRQKVLAPRRGWDRAEWMPVPVVSYNRPGPQPEDLNQLVKLFLRLAVGGADEVASARGGELQFVGLFHLAVGEDRTVLSLTCPYEEPRRLMKQVWGTTAAKDPQVFARISRDLDFKCKFVGDIYVPIVFVFSPTSDSVLLINHNHFSNPNQFIVPELCQTTSGFLNFIGASNIKGSSTTIVRNLEPLMNKGLDEWFRWLYCTTETGILFDPALLLVRRSDPEEWVYDYNG